jgi:uncharacterized integral membrane protein
MAKPDSCELFFSLMSKIRLTPTTSNLVKNSFAVFPVKPMVYIRFILFLLVLVLIRISQSSVGVLFFWGQASTFFDL